VAQEALSRVEAATRELAAATAQAEDRRRKWIAAMKEARRQGASYRAIARVAGVSWQRVAELVKET
jgi:hypothetical protein